MAITCLLVCVMAPTVQAEDCATALDRAVGLYRHNDPDSAAVLLESLREHCSAWPQLHHGLGVLAAAEQRWDAALAHLQRALDADRRSADTAAAIRAIHRYRAALALREALGRELASTDPLKPPVLSMQDASVYTPPRQPGSANPDSAGGTTASLRDVSTIEYELYDWWQSAAQGNQAGWLQHYAPEYPPPEHAWRGAIDWASVRRDISFTAEDAVVVLSGEFENSEPVHVLMLLRLAGHRWQIYRESRL